MIPYPSVSYLDFCRHLLIGTNVIKVAETDVVFLIDFFFPQPIKQIALLRKMQGLTAIQ